MIVMICIMGGVAVLIRSCDTDDGVLDGDAASLCALVRRDAEVAHVHACVNADGNDDDASVC